MERSFTCQRLRKGDQGTFSFSIFTFVDDFRTIRVTSELYTFIYESKMLMCVCVCVFVEC